LHQVGDQPSLFIAVGIENRNRKDPKNVRQKHFGNSTLLDIVSYVIQENVTNSWQSMNEELYHSRLSASIYFL